MTYDQFDDILSASDDDLQASAPGGRGADDREAHWVKADEVLYQPIVITRANVTDIADNFNMDSNGNPKTKTVAFVNFFYADDEAETPYVFKTGWQAIRAAVLAFNAQNAFPVACGVTEMLNRPAVAGHYPLRFSPPDQLEALQDAAVAHSAQQTAPSGTSLYGTHGTNRRPATTGEPIPPVAAPSATAASSARGVRTSAARAIGGSVPSNNLPNNLPNNANLPNNLRTRGN